MNQYSAGDLFLFQAGDLCITGRILLDVKAQCVKPQCIGINNPLYEMNGTLLVEIYETVQHYGNCSAYEYLIPGVFVDSYALDSGKWPIVGHEPIDPTLVEFPEALTPTNDGVFFKRGEISIHVCMAPKDIDKMEVPLLTIPSLHLPDICLYYLDMKEFIDHPNPETMNLGNSDLRVSNYRKQVYCLLGETDSQSYYEISKSHGYDVTRFYTLC